MPLVRFEVKNEYGLGDPELYRGEARREDPRAVLDGVAVAGLVGILRQLGDLAQFAADVFQDLHDQVMATAARGQKMLTRIQRIESALPSLEMAVQVPRSYIHFAYISGADWHPSVRTDENQLLCSDLPQFMIDCYEECSEPPRLYLLDKFDSSGAGACLKRYSDPSYFKRALSSSEPVKADKVKRKKKKRGSQMRSAGLQHVMLSTRNSNSAQFASPSTDQLSFSVENASTPDTRSKSELLRESTFFDPEIRPNCADQFPDTPSTVPGVPDSNDASASVLHVESNEDCRDDDSQSASLQQPSAPSSSSVTWDEKIEIVESTSPKSYADELVDRVQDLDTLPQRFETSNLCSETAKLGCTVNQEDIVFELTKVPVPSETHNRTDANNILETDDEMDDSGCQNSIVETEVEMEDSECQTKWEVTSPSHFNHGDVESKSGMLNETSPMDPCPFTSCNSLNNYVGPNFTEVIPSEDINQDQSTDSSCHTPTPGSPVRNGHPESSVPYVTAISNSELLENELFDSESSIANEQDLLVERANNQTSTSQDSPVTSNPPAVQIWTNGGILGLEPSKPPLGAVTSDGDLSIKSSNESIGGPLSDNFDKKPETLSSTTKTYAHSNGTEHIQTDVAPGSGLTVISKNAELCPSGSDKNLFGNNPTSFSGLAHKFLSDSLQRKILLAQVGVSKPSQLVNADFTKIREILLQTDHKDLPKGVVSNSLCSPETEENTKMALADKPASLCSPYSGSSSPPLEHMKISFHPMNSLEASRLKLEFSSGCLNEDIGDKTFPSFFQLIPGPSTTLVDSGSESDDDTFCRSSAYSSEDLFSPHSNSNSEMWGEDERSENEKPKISNNSFRISSPTSSVHSSMKVEQIDICKLASELRYLEVDNDTVISHSDLLKEFSVNSEVYAKNQQQESGEPLSSSNIDTTSNSPYELPPPPPLPPLEWRLVKQYSASLEDNTPRCGEVIENLNAQTHCFTHQNHQEQDAARPLLNGEAMTYPWKNMHDQQECTGQTGPNHNFDCKEQIGREDLLHQIRSKSFNLKRTIIEKPSQTAGPTTNANVVAIIEKADIIRQAFPGDNERIDDDNWSEC